MTIIWQILTIIGSLGIFLFGIKMLSESLQKVAGKRMRSVLTTIAANKYRSIFTGLVITSVIQSSSATSVMIISFVNAGLLSLYQAAGVLIGANIGTTLTIWMISFLGFKISLNVILLPVIALSLPFYFSLKSRWKSIGESLFGFALLFLGVELLKDNLPVLDESNSFVRELAGFTGNGLVSLLLFIAVGVVFTLLLQSSSVTLALTLVMCNNGWINFEISAAMVLGINIGTTSTAIIASFITNAAARRAALFHVLFNVTGMLWAALLFKPYMYAIEHITLLFEDTSPFTSTQSIPVALSLVHTSLNVVTAVLVSGLLSQYIRLINLLVPERGIRDNYRLTYLSSPISTSELSVLQAGKEIHVFGKRTEAMFEFLPRLLIEKNEEDFGALFDRIRQYEAISDRMQEEIASFLIRISASDLSWKSSKKIRSMLKIIDDLEKINDTCMKMASLIRNKNEEKAWFTQKMRNEIGELFGWVSKSLIVMNRNLENFDTSVSLGTVNDTESAINGLRDHLLQKNQKRLSSEKIQYSTAKYYSEFVGLSEKIGDFTLDISKAVADSQEECE